jgi:hypothetical protein
VARAAQAFAGSLLMPDSLARRAVEDASLKRALKRSIDAINEAEAGAAQPPKP